MDFRLTEEQVDLQQGVRAFCDGNIPAARLPDLEESGGVDPKLWKELAELGVFGDEVVQARVHVQARVDGGQHIRPGLRRQATAVRGQAHHKMGGEGACCRGGGHGPFDRRQHRHAPGAAVQHLAGIRPVETNPRGFVPILTYLVLFLNVAIYVVVTLPLSTQPADPRDPTPEAT